MSWAVRATPGLWQTAAHLRSAYDRAEYAAIVRTPREAIAELAEKGTVEECGWELRALTGYPFNDGGHLEFHIHDDGALAVYHKRERKRVIRMIDVYGHEATPGSRERA